MKPAMDRVWPVCTVAGCEHGLTHATADDMFAAWEEQRDRWVSVTGCAVCVCHSEVIANDARVVAFRCDLAGRNLGDLLS